MNKVEKVNIHGKDYITVAGRLQLAHKALKTISITTEILPIEDQIVVKATVVTEKGTFTGISAANPAKLIEKQSPYEVAETSAVGRALGFAGFGAEEFIATADEIQKTQPVEKTQITSQPLCTCKTTNKYHAFKCPARVASSPVQQ